MQANSLNSVEALMSNAATAHAKGNLKVAVECYQAVLRHQPQNFDALQMLGVAYLQVGRLDSAIEFLTQAHQIKPQNSAALGNLATAQRLSGQFEVALRNFEKAVILNPKNADAWYNRGLTASEFGSKAIALESVKRAIALRPRNLAFQAAFGKMHIENGSPQAAVEALERVIELEGAPADAWVQFVRALLLLGETSKANDTYRKAREALAADARLWNGLGQVFLTANLNEQAAECFSTLTQLQPNSLEAFNRLGLALRAQKKHEEAIAAFGRAHEIDPNNPGPLANMATALSNRFRVDAALQAIIKAVELRPNDPKILLNQANILLELGRPSEALEVFQHVAAIRPNDGDVLSNMAGALLDLGRLEESRVAFDQALALDPNNDRIKFSRAPCDLILGDFDKGWLHYESRWNSPAFDGKRPICSARFWAGESLAGRSILVFNEQGFGDTFQFCRFVNILAETGAKVTFASPVGLRALLSTLHPDISLISTTRDAGPFDFQIALMSLPFVLKTREPTIPASVPYLHADTACTKRWNDVIGAHGIRVGIHWWGRQQLKRMADRSVPLHEFGLLASVPNIRLISLQKGDGIESAIAQAHFPIQSLGSNFDSGPDAFFDAAAVISNLDLVITNDTSIAHLAGALGKPVWIALKHVAEWRWLIDRTDSPWYPSAKLFRQRQRGDWASVFESMRDALIAKGKP